MLPDSCYTRLNIDSAKDLLAFEEKLPPPVRKDWWLFRGVPRAFSLETTLERVLVDAAIPLAQASDIERQLLKEFKRRAHQYGLQLPSNGDVLGWLALMQHYGAPTRLLDWTYSFYVAAFFALSDAISSPVERREPCYVWALWRDAFPLEKARAPTALAAYEAARHQSSDRADMGRPDADNIYDGINAFLLSVAEVPEKCVWAVNSFQLNDRLSVQQGAFMCPGDVQCSFEENLLAAKPTPANVVRFELSTEPSARAKMLSRLHQMNINTASLFPGLDGFARSLRQKPWVSGTLRPSDPSHVKSDARHARA